MRLYRALLTLLLLPLFAAPAHAAEDALWSALKEGGHVVLMRHALAPGTGDPSTFSLDDCATQRVLNDVGRQQARDTGAAFRAHGVPVSRVLTSQWCRCVETAELLDLAPVEEEPLLNSFFRDRSRGPAQIAGLEDLIADLPRDGDTVVMVTHQVVITGLTDVFPASGEMIVLRLEPGGGWAQAGRIGAR